MVHNPTTWNPTKHPTQVLCVSSVARNHNPRKPAVYCANIKRQYFALSITSTHVACESCTHPMSTFALTQCSRRTETQALVGRDVGPSHPAFLPDLDPQILRIYKNVIQIQPARPSRQRAWGKSHPPTSHRVGRERPRHSFIQGYICRCNALLYTIVPYKWFVK